MGGIEKDRSHEMRGEPLKKIAVLLSMLILISTSLAAHESDEHAQALAPPGGRVLGTISFPTSTKSSEAQDAFIQGMLLLHLFEYPFARDQFLLAQEFDPDFALAYWGEAMSHNHPIWDEQSLDAARHALMKLGATAEARLSKTPVAREKGLLATLEVLYGPGTKSQRDQDYMRAMEQMAAQFPEDHEIQLFYALSVIGVNAGVRDIPSYMLATALAQSVFSQNPQHPGAAHYLIHGVDDPVHAVLGLQAARALSVMAPDAGHSQHMTSHIFVAVGMWNDVVSANENAVQVANAMRLERGENARNWGHYNFWLLYGLLQQGRQEKARELLNAAIAEARADGKAPQDRLILDPDRSLVGSVVQMWSRFIIDTGAWDSELIDWSFNSGDSFDPNLTISFIKAMRATKNGQVSESGQYLEQFRTMKSELEKIISRQPEPVPSNLLYLERLNVMEQQLLAAIEMARGENARAVVFAREASRLEGEMPFSFGPPFVDLPSAEFLGELLLNARKYPEAVQAFETQLERTRLRANTLAGLSRAQEKLGNEAAALYTLQKLRFIRQDADPKVKEEQ